MPLFLIEWKCFKIISSVLRGKRKTKQNKTKNKTTKKKKEKKREKKNWTLWWQGGKVIIITLKTLRTNDLILVLTICNYCVRTNNTSSSAEAQNLPVLFARRRRGTLEYWRKKPALFCKATILVLVFDRILIRSGMCFKLFPRCSFASRKVRTKNWALKWERGGG